MGRPPKSKTATPVIAARPPMMKYAEAIKLADKNARTIMKISQLLDVVHQPGFAEGDTKDRIGSHIEKLRSRLNRRLVKLAKWADSSSEDRHSEFRNNPNHNYPYRTLIKPMIYSKPIPTATINAMKSVVAPGAYVPSIKNASTPGPEVKTIVPAEPIRQPETVAVPHHQTELTEEIAPSVEVAPINESTVKQE